MEGIYKGFGEVPCMTSRKRHQFIDLLKIPLCCGVVLPKAQMQRQFREVGVLQHAEAFATLFMKLENKSGLHTSWMLSIAHILFLLVLFLDVWYLTKDLMLRLCAKAISAVNIRDAQRIRIHTMTVELLSRYQLSRASNSNLLLSSTSSETPCSMDASLIRHLVTTFLPAQNDVKYSEVPLQLCIISSLLTHGQFMCLCEWKHPVGGLDAKACIDSS